MKDNQDKHILEVDENDNWIISIDSIGEVHIISKKYEATSYSLLLFEDNFEYLYMEWNVCPKLYITPDANYCIVTYGVGYLFFIDLQGRKVVKEYHLFPEVDYSNDSFQEIDWCCYYNEHTRVDFSESGKYAVVRVRGDFDPQESDGREDLFTPVYFCSFFIIDLCSFEICLSDDFGDVCNAYKNIGAIAFNKSETLIAVGAFGSVIKIFNLTSRKCIDTLCSLMWMPDPLNLINCPLMLFLNDNILIYVNKDKNIVVCELQNMSFVISEIIETNIPIIQRKTGNRVRDYKGEIKEVKMIAGEINCFVEYGYSKEYEVLKYKLGNCSVREKGCRAGNG